MGSSAKKKKERKQDFQKTKLKVGKARPKNTNATDTSFSAKSIVFKQQSLSESGRDAKTLFEHNLSLLGSKSDTQRRDALQYLATTAAAAASPDDLPQPASLVVARAQSLILDGSPQVRQQLLKLLRALPAAHLGPVESLLLYTRAGMAHLSDAIRASALDVLDWLLDVNPDAIVCSPGGWVKTLRTFQNLLSWRDPGPTAARPAVAPAAPGSAGQWSSSKPPTATLGSSKLLVHQLTSLARLLAAGTIRPAAGADRDAAARRAATHFPLWHVDAHLGAAAGRSNPFGYLNLFGAPRDVESEVYDDPEERAEVLAETGLLALFRHGVNEAKKEGGEVGRAAAAVDKSLRSIEAG